MPVYMSLIMAAAFVVKELRYKNEPITKSYVLPALGAKFLGSILFCAIYVFYYKGGDVFVYYDDLEDIWELFVLQDPSVAWEILTSPPLGVDLGIDAPNKNLRFYRDPASFMVVRIAAVLSLFAFKSLWLTSILMATLSFTGIWALYRVFLAHYPKLHFPLARAVFFVPSLFFWGSSVMKDTITLGALGWLVYAVYHLFIQRNQLISSLIILYLSVQLINIVKGYIVAGFALPALYWILSHYISTTKDRALRILMTAMIGVGIFGMVVVVRDNIGTIIQFGIQKFIQMATDFQSYHGSLAEGGQSGYDLGTIEFTPLGILRTFPAAVNVTLFRPYLFEVRNPVMLISAFESTFMMLFALFMFLRIGFFRTLAIAGRTPIIMMCLLFSIIFGFAVGFTSYNFGALVRYKIPCIPFFVGALFMTYRQYQLDKIQERLPVLGGFFEPIYVNFQFVLRRILPKKKVEKERKEDCFSGEK